MNFRKSFIAVLILLSTAAAVAQVSDAPDTLSSPRFKTRYIRVQTNLIEDLCLHPNFGFELQVADRTALNCSWTMILTDTYWPEKLFYESVDQFRISSEYSGKEFSLGMKNFLTEDVFAMSEFSFKRTARQSRFDPGYGYINNSYRKTAIGGKLVFGRELARKEKLVWSAWLGSGISYVITRSNDNINFDTYDWVPSLCLGLNVSLQNVTRTSLSPVPIQDSYISNSVPLDSSENYTLLLSRENLTGGQVKKLLLPYRNIFVKLHSGEKYKGTDFTVVADSVIEVDGQRIKISDINCIRVNPKGSALRQVIGSVFFASSVLALPGIIVFVYYAIENPFGNNFYESFMPAALPVTGFSLYMLESCRLMSFRKFKMKNGWQISVVPYLPDEKSSPALFDVQTDNSNHVD